VDVRVGHRELRDELGDMACLGALAFQELQARGKIVEEIGDLDRGASGRADLGDRGRAARLDADPCSA
jgi:hypothetical protein